MRSEGIIIASPSQAADKLLGRSNTPLKQGCIRPWNTKEFGKQIGTVPLIVITSPDGNGDMVILRANEASGVFTAEVYQPDTASPNSNSWNPQSPEDRKSILKQPDGSSIQQS